MLKPENSKSTFNYSKENIKFSGSKDDPNKLHVLHKVVKIATKKSPTRPTSFIQIHYLKERDPRTI